MGEREGEREGEGEGERESSKREEDTYGKERGGGGGRTPEPHRLGGRQGGVELQWHQPRSYGLPALSPFRQKAANDIHSFIRNRVFKHLGACTYESISVQLR